jgi:hypothetical protein
MPHTANRTHSPAHSSPSDDENTLPQALSLSASKEALIKVSETTIFAINTHRLSEIARQHQAGKNALSKENEDLRRKLADISNNKDDETDENNGVDTAHRSKRQRTRNPTPIGSESDDENQDDTSTGQAEDEFVNNIGHKFCIIYAPWVHKGADIFKIKFDDIYDATERFEDDDNKVQGQLQEIVGLLKEQLSQDIILSQKWVRREVRGFLFLLTECASDYSYLYSL